MWLWLLHRSVQFKVNNYYSSTIKQLYYFLLSFRVSHTFCQPHFSNNLFTALKLCDLTKPNYNKRKFML